MQIRMISRFVAIILPVTAAVGVLVGQQGEEAPGERPGSKTQEEKPGLPPAQPEKDPVQPAPQTPATKLEEQQPAPDLTEGPPPPDAEPADPGLDPEMPPSLEERAQPAAANAGGVIPMIPEKIVDPNAAQTGLLGELDRPMLPAPLSTDPGLVELTPEMSEESGLTLDEPGLESTPVSTDTPWFDSLDDSGWLGLGGASYPGYRNYHPAWSSGFDALPGGLGMGGPGPSASLRRSFRGNVFLSGTYDSNPSQGYRRGARSTGGDFYLMLGGTLAYQSVAPVWTVGASYTGGYRMMFEETDLSGYFQNAGAYLRHNGSKLDATLSVGMDFGSGANRYYSAVVDELSYSVGLAARYAYSHKTTLSGNASFRQRNTSGRGRANTWSWDAGFSVLWRYSARTELGPGIRYTLRGGGNRPDRATLGPTITVNYRLSGKLSLNSRVGLDFVKYQGGGTESPFLSVLAGANWQASDWWGMNLSLYRDVDADGSRAGSYRESTGIRLGYHRRLGRYSFQAGVAYENSTYQSTRGAGPARPDRDYVVFDASIGRRFLSERMTGTVYTRFRTEDRGGAAADWDAWQLGLSLGYGF